MAFIIEPHVSTEPGSARPGTLAITQSHIFRWEDARIPYEINVTSGRAKVEGAIDEWNKRTRLKLVEHDGEPDFVCFVNGSACGTPVGRQGRAQNITCDVGSSSFSVGSVIHEIGHSVGFIHEHQRSDRSDFVDIDVDALHSDIRHNFRANPKYDSPIGAKARGCLVGEYEFESIMHYSQSGTVAGHPFSMTLQSGVTAPVIGQRDGLSTGDIAAIDWMVGRYISMCECNSMLFIIQNGHLHRVNPANLHVDQHVANWGGQNSMVALNNRLYIVQNSHLHRVEPSNLNNIEQHVGNWDGYGWGNKAAIVAASGALVILTYDRLYRVNPATLGVQQSVGNWAGPTSMTTIGNRVYIIQNGHLHRVDPANLSIEQHVGNWDGRTYMTAIGNRLYIIQNGHLHCVDPSNLQIEQHVGNWD